MSCQSRGALMSDIHALRGPAGQPRATSSFVGSLVAAPAPPPGQPPAGSVPFRGFLAGDEGAQRFLELTRNPPAEPPPRLPGALSPEEKIERLKLEEIRLRLEARDMVVRDRALAEPEVRKALARGTPGRKGARSWYDDLAAKCLNEATRDIKQAQKLFIERAMKERSIELSSARNRWSETMRRGLFPGA
jgi:hypothetical protein